MQAISILTPYELTDRNWHLVQIERNRKETVLVLDKFSKANPEDEESFRPFYLKNKIMIGSSASFKDGFVGCMRTLILNGRLIDLVALAQKTVYGLSVGCVEKCKSNPCLNHGVCLEFYHKFECDCTFTPFRGPICGTEIGTHLEAHNFIKYTIPKIGLVGSTQEIIQAQFSTYLKNGLIMQVVSDKADEKGNYDFLTIELNNNGGIKVKFNYGFDSFEYNSPVYVANGQSHSFYIERNKKNLRIIVDEHEPVLYFFNKTNDYDMIFDSPRYIYIGRNETILDTKGFFGCISRLQFNRFFPLKYAFLEEKDPNIFVYGTNIRARMCDIEPVTYKPEPSEYPPERDIKIVELKRGNEEKLKFLGIVVGVPVGFFGFLVLVFVLACFYYKRVYAREKSYKTKEDKPIKIELNASVVDLGSISSGTLLKRNFFY